VEGQVRGYSDSAMDGAADLKSELRPSFVNHSPEVWHGVSAVFGGQGAR
jgi:hypothetical protein